MQSSGFVQFSGSFLYGSSWGHSAGIRVIPDVLYVFLSELELSVALKGPKFVVGKITNDKLNCAQEHYENRSLTRGCLLYAVSGKSKEITLTGTVALLWLHGGLAGKLTLEIGAEKT